MTDRDDGTRSARQLARGRQRKAGDRSARLALQLMKLGAPALKRLTLEDELREAIERARAVTSHIARRRAERSLAGELRRHDLIALAEQLASVATDNTDIQLFHTAEQWRTKLIEEGVAALPGFPAATDEAWPRLIDAARRERDTGRPPGSGRALFRQIMQALKAQADPAAGGADGEGADGEGADGDDGDGDGDDVEDRGDDAGDDAARE